LRINFSRVGDIMPLRGGQTDVFAKSSISVVSCRVGHLRNHAGHARSRPFTRTGVTCKAGECRPARSHRQPARPIICSRAAMQKARWTDSAREIADPVVGFLFSRIRENVVAPAETRTFPPTEVVRRAINLVYGIVNFDSNVFRCFLLNILIIKVWIPTEMVFFNIFVMLGMGRKFLKRYL